jgi:hypothetical protein
MKVWELINALSRAPANSEVIINKGEKSFHIDRSYFQDWDYEGFDMQFPVTLDCGREDK